MMVSAQYAQEHFADILSAFETGQEVELTRSDQPRYASSSVRLMLVEPAGAEEQPASNGRPVTAKRASRED